MPSNPSQPRRCAVYAPASVGTPAGPEAQLAELREYAAGHGYEVVHEAAEASTGRPGPVFRRMVESAKTDGVTHVIVHGHSALGRKVGDAREHLDRLEAAGLTLVTTEDGENAGVVGNILDALASADPAPDHA